MEQSSNKNSELRNKLKLKLNEKSLSRSTKIKKEAVVDKNFKKLGIDKEKFKSDLEAVKKQGGFTDEQMNILMNSMLKK